MASSLPGSGTTGATVLWTRWRGRSGSRPSTTWTRGHLPLGRSGAAETDPAWAAQTSRAADVLAGAVVATLWGKGRCRQGNGSGPASRRHRSPRREFLGCRVPPFRRTRRSRRPGGVGHLGAFTSTVGVTLATDRSPLSPTPPQTYGPGGAGVAVARARAGDATGAAADLRYLATLQNVGPVFPMPSSPTRRPG